MFTLNCKGKLVVVDKPAVMGIINTTPDSFYAGSRFTDTDDVLKQAEKMLSAGAGFLDIGGQSTRPGSEPVAASEEKQRVLPMVAAIRNEFPEAILSIDTWYADVAAEAVAAGADIINDVSGGNHDPDMIRVAASLDVPYVAMHMKGDPSTMQNDPHYENVTQEVLDYFIAKCEECRVAGINDVIIDPGFGFGKTIAHNFQLLRELAAFSILKKPILIGLSRKGTIYKTLGNTAAEALNGTTVLNTLAVLNGAAILRVHDVKEAMEVVKLMEAYQSSQP